MNTFYSLAHVPHQLTYNFVRDVFLLVCLFTNDITFLDYYNYDRLVTGCWKVKSAAKRILKTSLWLAGSRLPWLSIVCIGDAHLHVNCEAEHEWNLKNEKRRTFAFSLKIVSYCYKQNASKCATLTTKSLHFRLASDFSQFHDHSASSWRLFSHMPASSLQTTGDFWNLLMINAITQFSVQHLISLSASNLQQPLINWLGINIFGRLLNWIELSWIFPSDCLLPGICWLAFRL